MDGCAAAYESWKFNILLLDQTQPSQSCLPSVLIQMYHRCRCVQLFPSRGYGNECTIRGCRICEGSELHSYILEGIEFEEKASTVGINEYMKNIFLHTTNPLTPRCACAARGKKFS